MEGAQHDVVAASPHDDRFWRTAGRAVAWRVLLAVAMALVAAYTYARGGWLVVGQYAFCYVLIWFAVRVKITRWDKYGDFSYGIYIIGWPLMYFATFFDLQEWGWFAYHAVVIIGCHIYAFASWHLIERPAMTLKGWTPRWLTRLLASTRPARERVANQWRQHAIVTPSPKVVR